MPRTTLTPSRTEQFLQNLAQMPLVRQVIPLEAEVGWPLPMRRHGRLFVCFPFYSLRRPPSGSTELFPLFATITVDWATQAVVEFTDLRYTGLCPRESSEPIGTFPHPAVTEMTVGEYRQARSDLFTRYDTMFDALAANRGVDEAFAAEFSGLFQALLEPSLEPQYRVLAGKFIERFKKS